MTGVHIAYWFARRNRELAPLSTPSSKDNDSNGEEGNNEDIGLLPKAPPQVIYCGPSNKSVDVVASKYSYLCYSLNSLLVHLLYIHTAQICMYGLI